MVVERYLVPRARFADRESLRSSLFEVMDNLEDAGFEFVESANEESDTNRMTRFSDEPETSHLELWEDYVAKVRYIRVETPSDADLSTVETAVTESIPMESHAALCATFSGTAEPSLLYRIAYSAPTDFSEETAQVVRLALQSARDEVAVAAAEAAGIIGWHEFVMPLRSRDLETEPGMVRRAIRRALALLSPT